MFFKIFKMFGPKIAPNCQVRSEKSQRISSLRPRNWSVMQIKRVPGAPPRDIIIWYPNFQKCDLIWHICGRPSESSLRLVCKFSNGKSASHHSLQNNDRDVRPGPKGSPNNPWHRTNTAEARDLNKFRAFSVQSGRGHQFHESKTWSSCPLSAYHSSG